MENFRGKRLKYSVCQTLRVRWNMTQAKLASSAGVSQADISEMENYEPYGQMGKYLRVARFFAVPVDAILRNDFRLLGPLNPSFPELLFTEGPNDTEEKIVGRMGEELVYEMERERIGHLFPGLADLILPHYKIKAPSPGYDIMSFDDDGIPLYIEVKTSRPGALGFSFTAKELDTARKFISMGLNYTVRHVVDWGTESRRVIDLPFSSIEKRHNIKARHYWCSPKVVKTGKISGLAYFRELRGMKQAEFSELMGITQTQCSLCENASRRPEVGYYLRASDVLNASIEELLAEYERSQLEKEVARDAN